MNFILIIIVGFIVIVIIVLAMFREHIKNETNKLSNTISNIPSYYEKNKYRQSLKNIVRFDIPNDLSNSFENEYISNQQKHDFINHYEAYYQEIYPKYTSSKCKQKMDGKSRQILIAIT